MQNRFQIPDKFLRCAAKFSGKTRWGFLRNFFVKIFSGKIFTMILAFSNFAPHRFAAIFSREKILAAQNFSDDSRDLLLPISQLLRFAGFSPDFKNAKTGAQISQILFSAGAGNFTPARVATLLANLFSQNLRVEILDFQNEVFLKLRSEFPEKSPAQIAHEVFTTGEFQKVETAVPRFSARLKIGG